MGNTQSKSRGRIEQAVFEAQANAQSSNGSNANTMGGATPEPEHLSAEVETPFMQGLPRFLHSGVFSDFKIVVGESELQAHKLILCQYSGFFSKACRRFKEAEENVVKLHHGEEAQVRDMIDFMYRGAFEYEPVMDEDGVLAPCTCGNKCRHQMPSYYAEMYALADFYDVPKLAEASKDHFVDMLRVESKTDVDNLVSATVLVFVTTPESDRGLRDIVREYLVAHMEKLQKSLAIREMIASMPALALEIIDRTAVLCGRRLTWCSMCLTAIGEK